MAPDDGRPKIAQSAAASFPMRLLPSSAWLGAMFTLALASTRRQTDPVGVSREMRRLSGPLVGRGHEDAPTTTKSDAEWEEPAGTVDEWGAFLVFRKADRASGQDAPPPGWSVERDGCVDWPTQTALFA